MSDRLRSSALFACGYGVLPKAVMQDKTLHVTAKAIYAYFCSYAGAGDSCFPSRDKICYDLSLSVGTFTKYLRQLSDCGYITIEQVKDGGKFSHNLYTLNPSPCIKLPHTEMTDTENTVYGKIDTKNNIHKKEQRFKNIKESRRFTPPSLEEVKAYCKERNNGIDPQRFIDYYTSNGWKVGRNSMRDWKAALRTWEQREKRDNKPASRPQQPEYEDFFEMLDKGEI